MRLQKYLSRAGVASRRASEEIIVEGRVRVDGRVVTELGTRVDPASSVVEVDGRRVRLQPARWLALHKPPACLCTRDDPEGRRTVYDLLPAGSAGLFHVGRLDYMSEGLLLLTNEGGVAHRLLHPSAETPRRYEVEIGEPVPPRLVRTLLEGIELEDGPAAADAAALLPGQEPGEKRLLITLHEGRNREIRRLMDALGVEIHRLRRLSFGPIELGDLPAGAHRALTEDEVGSLRATAGEGREGGSRGDHGRRGTDGGTGST